MFRTPSAFVQYFTQQQTEKLLDPNVIAANTEPNAAAFLSADISGMQAAKPYSNFGLPIPSWGAQTAANAISALPSNVINTQKEMAELPVTKAKAQTELQEQQLAHNRLKSLLNPTINPTTGKPEDISPYVTQISGPNVSVATQPLPFGGTLPVQVTPNQTNPQTQPNTDTTQPTNTQTDTTSHEPVVPQQIDLSGQYGGSTGVVDPFSVPTTANPAKTTTTAPVVKPSASLGAGSGGATAATIPTTPVALDTLKSMSNASPPPAHVLDWYQHTQDTRAQEARAETGPDGKPTGRTIIMHDPKSGLADQPVHPAYMAANLGDWKPDNITPPQTEANPAIAGADTDPNNASTQLATGNLTPSQIIALGGPLTAGTNRSGSAQPNLPPPVPQGYTGKTKIFHGPVADYLIADDSNAQMGPPGKVAPQPPNASNLLAIQNQLHGQPAPARTAATPAPTPIVPLNTTGGVNGNHPAISENAEGDDYFKKNFGGMTGAQFGKIFTDPKQVTITGKSESTPLGGNPDQTGTVNIGGQDYNGFIDKDGNPYLRRSLGPYSEEHVYANGTVAHIDNEIGKNEDMQMMKDSMEAGTVTGNWQSLSRADKISAYRQAQIQKAYPVNEEATKRVLALENVLDTGNSLLNKIQQNASGDDPTALNIRNIAHHGYSDTMNLVGPAVKDITKGAVNPGVGDPNSNYLNESYNQWMKANHEEQTTRALPPKSSLADSDTATYGAYTDPELPTEVRNAMTKTGVDLNKQVDAMVANHNRLNASTVYKANLVTNGETAPAANPQTAIQNVTSQDLYDKVPMYGWYKTPGYPAVQKLPKPKPVTTP